MNEYDKVLGMVRETMLHENVLERFSFVQRQVILEIWQPNPEQAWPDIYLELTFSGVVSLNLHAPPDHPDFAGDVVTFTGERFGSLYRARLATRHPDATECHLDLTFADLKYHRDPHCHDTSAR